VLSTTTSGCNKLFKIHTSLHQTAMVINTVERLEGTVWGTEDRAIVNNPGILSIRSVERGTELRTACCFNVVAHACNDGMLSVHRYCLRTAAELPPHIHLG
jgi:hypothetical protein